MGWEGWGGLGGFEGVGSRADVRPPDRLGGSIMGWNPSLGELGSSPRSFLEGVNLGILTFSTRVNYLSEWIYCFSVGT